jgi:hypothetical protein
MISKVSGAHQMFPGSMPTVTLTVKCMRGFVLFIFGALDDAAEGSAAKLDGGAGSLGPCTAAGRLGKRQVQEVESTLSRETSNLNFEFPAGRLDLKFEDDDGVRSVWSGPTAQYGLPWVGIPVSRACITLSGEGPSCARRRQGGEFLGTGKRRVGGLDGKGGPSTGRRTCTRKADARQPGEETARDRYALNSQWRHRA